MTTANERKILETADANAIARIAAQRGRKPAPAAAPVAAVVDVQVVAQAVAAADALPAMHDAMDEVLAAGIDLGRLEAMDFVLTVSTSAIFAIYENVKKSKAWRLLRNPQSSDGQNFQNLDEFCQVKLGKSYKRLQQMAGNQAAIGQEAFEQAERLGLRQRDYNAIKTLPAPDQELVRRAVEEAQSRDEVLDLLQELAARHAKEKQTLAAEHQATQALLADKSEALLRRADEVERLQSELRLIKIAPPDKVAQKLLEEAGSHLETAKGAIGGVVRDSVRALMEHSFTHAGERGQAARQEAARMLGELMAELRKLRDEFAVPGVNAAIGAAAGNSAGSSADERPEWQRWADQEDASTAATVAANAAHDGAAQ